MSGRIEREPIQSQKETKRQSVPGAEQGNVPLFVKPDGKLAFYKPMEKLIDDVLLEQQSEHLHRRVISARKQLGKARANTRGERNAVAADQSWRKAMGEVVEVMTAMQDLTSENTHIDHQILQAYMGGAMINTRDKAEAHQRVFGRLGWDITEYHALHKFFFSANIDIKVGEVSFLDFYRQDKNHQLPVSSILRFLVELRKTEEGVFPENFYEDNDSELGREYPQLLIAGLVRAEDIAAGVINGAYNHRHMPKFQWVGRDYPLSKPATMKLFEKTREFNERLIEVVTDPENQEFADTSEVVQKYMNGSPITRNYLVHLLAFAEKNALQGLYRKTDVLNKKDASEFYTQFSSTLLGYTEAISDFVAFYTKDDIEEIFHENGIVYTGNVPSIDEFRKQVAGIIPNKPKDVDKFGVDPERIMEIDWGRITPPQSAEIIFTKNKPMNFSIQLNYENVIEGDTVEETTLEFTVDAKKGTFDWNFIEDPKSLEMQSFSNEAKIVLRNMLGALSEGLAEKKLARKQAKQEQERARTSAPSPKLRAMPEVTKASPAKRRPKKGERSPMEAIEEAAQVEEHGIKRFIIVPEDQEMEDRMRQISAEDRVKVREGIEAFNKRGVGGFKMLSADPKNGRLFILRINTGSKGIRVLLREGGKDETHSKYTIIDIKRRKDIYRGRNNPWSSEFKLRDVT